MSSSLRGLAVKSNDKNVNAESGFPDLVAFVSDRVGTGVVDHRLTATLVYRRGLWSTATATEFAERLRRLLERALDQPDRPLATLDLLCDDERERLLVGWNGRVAEGPGGVAHRLFEAHARATRDAPAVVSASGTLTYRDLDDRADRWARLLRSRGVGPETTVGLALPMVSMSGADLALMLPA